LRRIAEGASDRGMAHVRRSRDWWRATVSRWQRSGESATAFAARAKINAKTLTWWSSELRRDTRAQHGSSALVPIEIDVPRAPAPAASIEIALGFVVIRCDVGSDVAYVASLVRALKGSC
jgi:hypothetical protein